MTSWITNLRVTELARFVRWSRRVLVIVLVIAGPARAQQISVQPADRVLSAAAGESLTLRFAIENAKDTHLQLAGELNLPPGWRLLLPLLPTEVEPQSRRVLLVPIVVSPLAEAGEYSIEINLRSAEGEIYSSRQRVAIREQRSIDVGVIKSPTLVVSEPYEIVYLVSNSGNVTEEVSFELVGNQGFLLSMPGPGRVRLLPGESANVLVLVDPRSERPVDHVVTLYVRASEGVVAAASATTRIAVASAREPLRHTFDLTAQVATAFDTRSSGAPHEVLLENLSLGLEGSGRLREGDPGVLTVDLSMNGNTSFEAVTIEYDHPDYRVTVGELAIGSPLLPTERGLGLSVSTPSTPEGSTHLSASAMIEGTPFWQVAARNRVAEGIEVSTEARLGADTALLVGGIKASRMLQGLGTFSVQARHGLDLTARALGIDLALDLEGQHLEALLDLTYLAQGYGNTADSEHDYGVSLAVPVGSNVGSYEFYGGFRDTKAVESIYRGGFAEFSRHGSSSNWSVGYSDYRLRDGDGDAHVRRQNVYLRSKIGPFPSVDLWPQLQWRQETDLTDSSVSRAVLASLVLEAPVFNGVFKPGVELDYGLREARLRQVELTASWDNEWAGGTELYAYGAATLLADQQVSFRLQTNVPVGAGREFFAESEYKLNQLEGNRLWGEVGVRFPLSVPLGRRSDIGEVSGVITDSTGRGMPGLVVSLAGYTSETKIDGTFEFPAVPAGRHLMSVQGLDGGQVTAPNLPLLLTVPADDSVFVELTAFEASVLNGQVTIREIGQEALAEGVIIGPNRSVDVADVLQRLAVEVEGPHGREQAVSTADGRVRFTHLTPGRWHVRILAESVPEYFRVEPASVTVELKEGTLETVHFELVPILRRIQFQDGGEVGN